MMTAIAILTLLGASATAAGIFWYLIKEFDHKLPYLPLFGLVAASGVISLIPMVGWLIGIILFYFVLMRWSGMSFLKTLGFVIISNIVNYGLWRIILLAIEKMA